ncbi:MAG: flavin reductase family protein [Chloroflexi bacterium]|nr:flavin reductase family protein [Chloroflexota bacterium]
MKRLLEPNTVLYPVPLVIVVCGTLEKPNLLAVNRIASVAAEPPQVAMSLRRGRYSMGLIQEGGEFTVNLPTPALLSAIHLIGTTTGRDTDKVARTGLALSPAAKVKAPLVAACPINIECRLTHTIDLRSHLLFIAEVVAVHAEESVLNHKGEIDYRRCNPLVYEAAIVRERPND